ncbi:hypothetical protein M8494_15780 [Serratia ureilytica]
MLLDRFGIDPAEPVWVWLGAGMLSGKLDPDYRDRPHLLEYVRSQYAQISLTSRRNTSR